MIEIMITYAVIAAAFIIACAIEKIIDKQFRRIEREARRQQARREQEEISEFYQKLIFKQIWGEIK